MSAVELVIKLPEALVERAHKVGIELGEAEIVAWLERQIALRESVDNEDEAMSDEETISDIHPMTPEEYRLLLAEWDAEHIKHYDLDQQMLDDLRSGSHQGVDELYADA